MEDKESWGGISPGKEEEINRIRIVRDEESRAKRERWQRLRKNRH